MRKSVFLATVLVVILLVAPMAGAQTTVDSQGEFGTEAIDTDTVTDRVGLVDPVSGLWSLRMQNGAINSFFYGNPGDFPMVGDWDCDGIDTPGLYRQSDGFVYLKNSNSQGVADIRFFFGNPSDIPLAGDFNGDGCDSVSIYRPSEGRIYVINELGANEGGLGAADFFYDFGDVGDKPFVGDFNGDTIDSVGLHRESTGFVYFRQSLTTGIADSQFFFGDPGDRLVAGDWGVVDNVDSPALFRPTINRFFFRYTNTQGVADEELVFGEFRMLPVAGSWTIKLGLGGALAKQVVQIPFAQRLNPIGGKPPYTVAMLAGPGFVSVSNDGWVSGNAPSAGVFNLTVRVTDSTGKTADQAIPLTVTDGCDTNNQIPAAQCLALVDLYRKTNGNGWINKADWFSTGPCQWFGVTCAGANVSAIVLEGNNLAGSIATVPFGNLSGLQEINLQQNALSGGIAPSLGTIASLLVLDLSDTGVSGVIPPLGGLANIDEIDLAENNLTGPLPATLANRVTLNLLDLADNPIGGALPNLFQLTQLLVLDLSQAGFTGPLHNMFGGMGAIQSINLSENQLTGPVPDSLGNPDKPAITDLDLAVNQLSGDIPGSLINLNTLPAPGGLTLCSNTALTIGGNPGEQPGVPLFDFVNARDDFWNGACP